MLLLSWTPLYRSLLVSYISYLMIHRVDVDHYRLDDPDLYGRRVLIHHVTWFPTASLNVPQLELSTSLLKSSLSHRYVQILIPHCNSSLIEANSVLATLNFGLQAVTLDRPLTIHLLNDQELLGKGRAIMLHLEASVDQRRLGTSHDRRPPLKQSLTWIE
jgi:hypothetical protein